MTEFLWSAARQNYFLMQNEEVENWMTVPVIRRSLQSVFKTWSEYSGLNGHCTVSVLLSNYPKIAEIAGTIFLTAPLKYVPGKTVLEHKLCMATSTRIHFCAV